MKETIQRLQLLADRADKYSYPEDSKMWVRISDIRAVLEFYEKTANVSEYTEQETNCKGCIGTCGQCKDEPPNVPDITPEWDKIPEGFDWVAVDEDGEEYAFDNEPFSLSACWIKGANVFTGRKLNMKGIDWTKTLSKRPAK